MQVGNALKTLPQSFCHCDLSLCPVIGFHGDISVPAWVASEPAHLSVYIHFSER